MERDDFPWILYSSRPISLWSIDELQEEVDKLRAFISRARIQGYPDNLDEWGCTSVLNYASKELIRKQARNV